MAIVWKCDSEFRVHAYDNGAPPGISNYYGVYGLVLPFGERLESMRPQPQSIHVLVVDDQDDDAVYAVRQLEGAGYDVQWLRVESSDLIHEAIGAEDWDIVLTANRRPDFSAVSALRVIRSEPGNIPAIVLSACEDESAMEECLEAGAVDFLQKDRMKRLPSAVQRAIRERDLLNTVKHTEEDLLMCATALDECSNAVIIVLANEENAIVYANQAFESITGYSRQEALGQNPRILRSGLHGKEFYKNMWESILSEGRWRGEIWNRRKNGEIYPEILTISKLAGADGVATHYVAVFSDISQEKFTEARIDALRYHDSLTNLPNRQFFTKQLENLLVATGHRNQYPTVMFVNLDRFANICHAFGHTAGDCVLQQVGRRLLGALRDDDTVARFGGDDFLILLNRVKSQPEVMSVLHKVLNVFSDPFDCIGESIHITASIGIASYPDGGKNANQLIQNAASALAIVREEGENRFAFYRPDYTESVRNQVIVEAELQQAILKDQLRLFLQPQISLETNEVVGAETLIRWLHPERGLVPPGSFIPVAEHSGLIKPIGEWVIHETCRMARRMIDEGIAFGGLSANVSSVQLNDVSVWQATQQAIREYDLPSGTIELEITESGLIEASGMVVRTMVSLRDIGVKLAIDDFGTGYSSLAYLRKLPLDKLKIDKSFVDDIPGNNDARAIVNGIVAMGHALGLSLIAEGVETEEQCDWLTSRGVEYGQGYYWAKPMPFDEFVEFMKRRQ